MGDYPSSDGRKGTGEFTPSPGFVPSDQSPRNFYPGPKLGRTR